MNLHREGVRAVARHGVQLSIAVAGVAAIVGSGGGFIGFSDVPPGGWPPVQHLPFVNVEPSRATASVGGSVVFKALPFNTTQPYYQWCRDAAGSGGCQAIPGATGDTYAVTGVNLADDGASYWVNLLSSGGDSLSSAYGRLAVSSMPGVVYQDGEFLPSSWEVSAVASPVSGGPTVTVTRQDAGGNPGAFESVAHNLTTGPSSIRVSHRATSATYNPAVQGAIYGIDFSEDCRAGAGQYKAYTTPLLEQSGRRYTATLLYWRNCLSTSGWETVKVRPSLTASGFERIDGPACGVGESCPDFSAAGAPISVGLVSSASANSGAPAGTALLYLDNWRVTVWRR